MISAVVADDEWYNLEEITELIEESGDFHVVQKYQNPIKLLEEIADTNPQVLFLDIEMPEIDGLNLAERIHEDNPDRIIVFITSFNQYAVQAFDQNAVDYIMKPIHLDRFRKMLEKVMHEVQSMERHQEKEIQILCFGHFEVLINHVPVKWERSKTEELFAFLLMNHHKYISKEVIIDLLWPEYEPKRALQLLQTSVYKIRRIFMGLDGKVKIEYNQNRYCLSTQDISCELFEVERLLGTATFTGQNKESFDEIYTFCQKGFLAQQGYLWGSQKEEEIKNAMLHTLNRIIKACEDEKDFDGQIRYMTYLSKMIPYDEEIGCRLLQMLKNSGQLYKARQHYEWLVKTLMDEYDIEPGCKLQREFMNMG